MKDVIANAKVVAALIATQRDDDWVNSDLVLHAAKALDLRYKGRLSETADVFRQGIWAGHESSKPRQVYKCFLQLVKKSRWSNYRILNELKKQWVNLLGPPAPGDPPGGPAGGLRDAAGRRGLVQRPASDRSTAARTWTCGASRCSSLSFTSSQPRRHLWLQSKTTHTRTVARPRQTQQHCQYALEALHVRL